MWSITHNIEEAEKQLSLMAVNADNWQKIYRAIIPIIQEGEKTHFDKEESPEGLPWDRNLKGTKTLWGIGNLFKDTQDDGNYFILDNILQQKHKHPGAGTHQFGYKVNIFGRGKLYQFPVRKFAGISKVTEAIISKTVGVIIING